MKINIGLTAEQRKVSAEVLAQLLADTYILYLKTQNFHWNVTGELFLSLHTLFEEQYQELATASDAIAERIRALGFPAPGSFIQFSKINSIKESITIPTAADMIKQLLADHELLASMIRATLNKVKHDDATAGFLINRLEVHEKQAWKLRSCES